MKDLLIYIIVVFCFSACSSGKINDESTLENNLSKNTVKLDYPHNIDIYINNPSIVDINTLIQRLIRELSVKYHGQNNNNASFRMTVDEDTRTLLITVNKVSYGSTPWEVDIKVISDDLWVYENESRISFSTFYLTSEKGRAVKADEVAQVTYDRLRKILEELITEDELFSNFSFRSSI